MLELGEKYADVRIAEARLWLWVACQVAERRLTVKMVSKELGMSEATVNRRLAQWRDHVNPGVGG